MLVNEVSGQVAGNKGHLDPDDAIPLYHQIYLSLRDEILRGDRPFGSVIPTEHELSAHYGVSRITVRRAVAELARTGLVERLRRVGTRVIHRAPAKILETSIDHALESLIAFGQDTEVVVKEISVEPAVPLVLERMRLPEGAEVVRAVRIRMREGVPLGEIVSYIPTEVSLLLTAKTLKASPMLSLLRDAGIRIGGASQTIEAIVADLDLSASLEVEPRAPALRVVRLVEDDGGRPVLLTVASYRADRYRIALDLHGHNQMLGDGL